MRGLVVLILVLAAAAAGADERVEDPDTEVARRHFNAGLEHYDHRDYPGAIAEFEAAKKVKPSPVFDFNIARCYERMERWREAVAAYERYLPSVKEPAEAEPLKARVAELKARIPFEAPPRRAPDAVAIATPPPQPAERPHRRRWIWGVVAGAGALVVAGVVVGVVLGTRSPERTLTPVTLP